MKNAEKLKKLLNTLNDVNRLRIIKCIGEGETSVGEIVEATGLSQPLVSHHLKILKGSAIVEASRKGPFVFYRLSSPRLLEVLGILSQMAAEMDSEKVVLPMFKTPPWWRKVSIL
jgi:DNA-binding transcriptional ArsR family regulator